MMLYLDSSLIVSMARGEENRSEQAVSFFEKSDEIFTSEMAAVECQAGIARDGAEVKQNLNLILTGLERVSIDSKILGMAHFLVKQYRASHALRSADAIHIATAQMLMLVFKNKPIEFLTSDRRQYAVATAQGLVSHLIE